MEVGSPEWIEASLAKLDELEQERAEHEAALESVNDAASLKHHSDALDRLDVEIKGLYAQLESFAEDEDEDEGDSEPEPAPAPAPAVAARPVAHAPVAAPASVPSPAPVAMATPAKGGGFDGSASISMSDDDLKPQGGGAKWAFLGVVLAAGIGVGGFFVWKDMEAKKAKQVKPEAGEAVTIDAAELPPDTESPNAAKGGDATISPTANPQPGGSSTGGGGTGGGSKPVEGKKKKPLELKGGTGSDPLG